MLSYVEKIAHMAEASDIPGRSLQTGVPIFYYPLDTSVVVGLVANVVAAIGPLAFFLLATFEGQGQRKLLPHQYPSVVAAGHKAPQKESYPDWYGSWYCTRIQPMRASLSI